MTHESRANDRDDEAGAGPDATIVTTRSPWSMDGTLARLAAVVTARGMKVYAVVDHDEQARAVGLRVPRSTVVMFGSPAAATPIIERSPLAALELPARVLVWEDGLGTNVSHAPAALAQAYGAGPDGAATSAMVAAVIRSVIDR